MENEPRAKLTRSIDAEQERQPGGEQEQQQSELQAVEVLFDERSMETAF